MLESHAQPAAAAMPRGNAEEMRQAKAIGTTSRSPPRSASIKSRA
jgi:hypothetical protein